MSQLSGMASVTYLELGAYVGGREHFCCGAEVLGGHYSASWPNIAYFCPACGEIWGRVVYDHHFAYTPYVSRGWVIESRRCVEHGDGEFLTGVPDELLSQCSPDLLSREVLALILKRSLA